MANWLARAAAAIPATRESPAAYKARQWRIAYPNGAAMDVLFTPAATRAEVAELYPGASIQPLPDSATRTPTAAEADELLALIGAILADDTEAERAEALAVALADPDAALVCWRSLAKAQGNQGAQR
jgi:hypothetical protein